MKSKCSSQESAGYRAPRPSPFRQGPVRARSYEANCRVALNYHQFIVPLPVQGGANNSSLNDLQVIAYGQGALPPPQGSLWPRIGGLSGCSVFLQFHPAGRRQQKVFLSPPQTLRSAPTAQALKAGRRPQISRGQRGPKLSPEGTRRLPQTWRRRLRGALAWWPGAKGCGAERLPGPWRRPWPASRWQEREWPGTTASSMWPRHRAAPLSQRR